MTHQINEKNIWTIGHSTRTWEDFSKILLSFQIEVLVDIRAFPGSRRYPHFNRELFEQALEKMGVRYFHFPDLGGRRKPKPDSKNTAWRNVSFRGYADYMESAEFLNAIEKLEDLAKESRAAYMCSEAVWWRCHRALVSDYLKSKGWKVNHISGECQCAEHPYTQPARQAQGNLF